MSIKNCDPSSIKERVNYWIPIFGEKFSQRITVSFKLRLFQLLFASPVTFVPLKQMRNETARTHGLTDVSLIFFRSNHLVSQLAS